MISTKQKKLSIDEEKRIENAEKALEKISHNFSEWVKNDLNKLYEIFDSVLENGTNEEKQKKLYIAIHDLVGNAETMGYKDITQMGNVVLHLLNNIHDLSILPKSLFMEYVRIIKCVEKQCLQNRNKISENVTKEVTSKTIDGLDNFYMINEKIIQKYAKAS